MEWEPVVRLGVGRIDGQFKACIVLPKNFVARVLLTIHNEYDFVPFSNELVIRADVHIELR